jgi:MoxR-like ATPase
MGKKIYNFDDFVNESYVSEGLFSWFKKNVMDRLTGWTKSFYQALENGLIKTIPSGPKKGKPVAMLFVPENGPIDKQIAEFYGTKANESQEIEEAVAPLEYTEEDQSVRNINAEDLTEEIMDLYESKVSGGRAKPIFIYGAPGIGKPQIVGQAATALGIPLLNLDLQFMGPEDFIGVPVQVDTKKPEFSEVEDETTGEKTMGVKDFGSGFTRSNPPSILPRNNGANGKGGIIFMDEANRANPIVLRSLMQFVQMGRIGDYNLPTKWVIVAAGNRPAEAEVAEFDFAFADRFTIVNYVPRA